MPRALHDGPHKQVGGYTKSGTLPKCGSATHDVKVNTSTKMCRTSEKFQHIVGSMTHLGVLHFNS